MKNFRMATELENKGHGINYKNVYKMRGPHHLETKFIDGQEANKEAIFSRKNLPNYLTLGLLGASAATLASLGVGKIIFDYLFLD